MRKDYAYFSDQTVNFNKKVKKANDSVHQLEIKPGPTV